MAADQSRSKTPIAERSAKVSLIQCMQHQIMKMGFQNLIASRLEYLAPEIWMKIFEWACRDSGATGRSLGLVNSDFRRLSRPYAYQSIHLPRATDIFAFRDFLSTLPADQKRVRFLHTPCPHIFMNTLSVDDDIYYEDDDFEDDGVYERAKGEPEESNALQHEALRDILNQVSSSLLVLSIFWNSKVAVFLEELLIPLPRLEELHIHRRFVDMRPHPQVIRSPMLSNLRRLHIAGRYSEAESIPFDDFLARLAPRLTHLVVPIFYIRSAYPILDFGFLC